MKRLPIVMTLKEAEAIAGRLGHPSKMPGYSYGISAQKCITGSKLRQIPGSVCRSCYAMTDWYRSWKPLLQGHQRRWNGLRHPRWGGRHGHDDRDEVLAAEQLLSLARLRRSPGRVAPREHRRGLRAHAGRQALAADQGDSVRAAVPCHWHGAGQSRDRRRTRAAGRPRRVSDLGRLERAGELE